MKALLNLPAAHTRALQILIDRIPPAQILWVLTGSAGLRLQGVNVPVNDLDVQSDRVGVYEIARQMANFVREAPELKESPSTRSHFGRLEVAGVRVELMGEMQHRTSAGGWLAAPELTAHRCWVEWAGMQVPVLELSYEAQAYARMGRETKAAAIRAALAAQGGRENA